MITNLPPPGGVSPHSHHHQSAVVSSPESAVTQSSDTFSQYEDEFQAPQQPGYPGSQSSQHYQYQQYHQYPQQYPPPQQVPHWHHQHGYYHPYPQQTYPSYSPSDPSAYHQQGYPNGYYDQAAAAAVAAAVVPGGVVPGQNTHNCTPSPIANSDDSGGDCVNESKGAIPGGRPGIIPLIPRPKGPRPGTSVMSAKRGGKRARQRDPNEPQKPVSAYALFFRDVQAGIKARNPSASFGEVSKHVAALWDGMEPDSKGAYKRRTEQAKKEYLRQLAAYRATLVAKGNNTESPYNGIGLDVIKAGEERTYLMSQSSRMAEPSGYVGHLGSAAASGAPQPPLQPNSSSSGSNSLTPLGSGKSPISTSSSSPHSTLGQSPNNGYHPQHLRPAANIPTERYPGAGSYQQQQSSTDPYNSSQQQQQQHSDHDLVVGGAGMMSTTTNCKRSGCPNVVRIMPNTNGRPMPEYCSNECLVNDNKQLANPYANTTNWQPDQQQQQHQQQQQKLQHQQQQQHHSPK